MTYTAEKKNAHFDREELKRRIPGWGVDADPANRPQYPKDRFDLETGAHWEFPERQAQLYPREKSPEHRFVTPVFGTTLPPKGISGMIRRAAYQHGEGKTMHWLMLMAADRVDVVESRLGALARGKPDRAFEEMGLRAEITRDGYHSRIGRNRNDVKHHAVDLLLLTARYAAMAGLAYGAAKLLTNGVRSRRNGRAYMPAGYYDMQPGL